MYFKKLELVGFKSFMNKTVLNFEPGITAIVGPNGCGKSNIFDAIRWVLGEQSEKALRGSQMVDVIFNGTDKYQPLSMGEVSLTFDNQSRYLPVDHNEVIVTRRIFRSGESEYLLNKEQVRLKDVIDLLMGTGIGAESYSIVAQGKIDMILSSRPDDRRLIFDEASGITKYKSQKREALRRLEDTEQNLTRVNDIISEVRRSIAHLERQANKARRYKEVFEELKRKEISLAIFKKSALVKDKNENTLTLQSLKEEEEAFFEIIRGAESRISEVNEESRLCEENIVKINNDIADLNNFISRDKQHINFNQQRVEELLNSEKNVSEHLDKAQQKLAVDEEKLIKFRQEKLMLNKNVEEKKELLRNKEEELVSLAENIKISLEGIARTKKDILEVAARISHVRNQITGLNSKEQIYLSRKKRLDIEKAKVKEDKTAMEDNISAIIQELKQIEAVLAELELKNIQMKTEMENEAASLNAINADMENMERQRITLISHKEFIQQLKVQYEGIDTSMNAVIYVDKEITQKASGLIVKLKEPQGVDPEAAGDPVPNPSEHGYRLQGEAKPVDLDAQGVSEKISQVEERLVSLRSVKEEKERYKEKLQEAYSVLLEQQKEQEMTLANKKTFHQAVLEQFEKIKDEESMIVLELSEVEGELAEFKEKLEIISDQLAEYERIHQAQEDYIHTEQEKVNINSSSREKVLLIIASTKAELEALQKRLNSDDNTLKMLEETCQHDLSQIEALKNQLCDCRDKQKLFTQQIKDLEDKINLALREIEIKNVSLAEAQDEAKNICMGIQENLKKIEEKKKETEKIKDTMYSFQMRDKDIEFKIISIKDRIKQVYNIDIEDVEGIQEKEIRREETVFICENRFLETYSHIEAGVLENEQRTDEQRPFTGLKVCSFDLQDEQAVPPRQEFDEDVVAEEIKKLRNKVDSYGNVNLVAIEEYDELKKRYDFLNQQHNDLVTSRDSLQTVIQKINRNTRKMFLETFEKVREEFKGYFRLLFNGGDAQLFLVDEQKPLESGIEIVCRPPGKKLQNVLLLSGGEKALAAIALIFAIFKVKPAPFCILDEIDAALDESNVDRFGRILQDFTHKSQFIVVTHNKKTIANADVMYGITMQESGISKIVSVKFSADKREGELTAAR